MCVACFSGVPLVPVGLLFGLFVASSLCLLVVLVRFLPSFRSGPVFLSSLCLLVAFVPFLPSFQSEFFPPFFLFFAVTPYPVAFSFPEEVPLWFLSVLYRFVSFFSVALPRSARPPRFPALFRGVWCLALVVPFCVRVGCVACCSVRVVLRSDSLRALESPHLSLYYSPACL